MSRRRKEEVQKGEEPLEVMLPLLLFLLLLISWEVIRKNVVENVRGKADNVHRKVGNVPEKVNNFLEKFEDGPKKVEDVLEKVRDVPKKVDDVPDDHPGKKKEPKVLKWHGHNKFALYNAI
jgi:hypothetical protein